MSDTFHWDDRDKYCPKVLVFFIVMELKTLNDKMNNGCPTFVAAVAAVRLNFFLYAASVALILQQCIESQVMMGFKGVVMSPMDLTFPL